MAERQHTIGKAKNFKRTVSFKHAGLGDEITAKHTSGKAKRADVVVGKTRSKGAKHADVVVGRTVRHLPDVSDKILRRDVERVGRVRVGALIVDSKPEEVEYSEEDFEVIFDLLGGSQTLGSAVKSDLDAHKLLHQGLPRAALRSLVDKIHLITTDEAFEALGVSLRTLQRHRSEPDAPLDVQQSGRAWKFAEILAKATRVLGSQDEAEQWLRRPAIGLDQQRPVDLLTTPAGVKLVEDYLGRLEYNVYT
jgi:putative toxin-antitoxin system antitoxin component (TIGR02293 family)